MYTSSDFGAIVGHGAMNPARPLAAFSTHLSLLPDRF